MDWVLQLGRGDDGNSTKTGYYGYLNLLNSHKKIGKVFETKPIMLPMKTNYNSSDNNEEILKNYLENIHTNENLTF